jgi:hypothetical protein
MALRRFGDLLEMTMPAPCKTSGRRIAALAQAQRVIDMRVAGKSMAIIAKAEKVSPARISNILTRQMDLMVDRLAETSEQARQLQVARSEELFAVARTKALAGGKDQWKAHAAAARHLDIINRLKGLYVEKTEVRIEESHEHSLLVRIDEYSKQYELETEPVTLQGDPPGDGGGKQIDSAGADGETVAFPGP